MNSRYERYRSVEPTLAPGWTIDTVVAPAPLYNANGIATGPDGLCWIAEARSGSVTTWNAQTDNLVTKIPVGGPLTSPDDLAFASDNTAYFSEFLDDRIDGLTARGNYFVLVEGSTGVNGITVTPDDRLFVNEFRSGGRLMEVDRRLPGIFRVIAELEFPNALELGADGRLYMPDVVAGTVQSVDPDTGSVRVEADGFEMPTAVKFDPRGHVAVAEHLTGNVWSIDLVTRERHLLAQGPAGLDNLCFDRTGRLYVSNAILCHVQRFDHGQLDAETGSGLLGPYGLGRATDGSVLVADKARIVTLSADVREGTVWERRYPDRTFGVVGVAALGEALVAVTDTGELRRLDPKHGTHERVDIGPPAAVTPFGTGVLVALADGRAIELDADLQPVHERSLGLPRASALGARDGNVTACDREGGVVVVETKTFAGFDKPEAVAFHEGAVLIAEVGARRVTRLDPFTGETAVVAADLPFGFPVKRPRADRRSTLLSLDDGSVLVGCDGDGSVRQLRYTN